MNTHNSHCRSDNTFSAFPVILTYMLKPKLDLEDEGGGRQQDKLQQQRLYLLSKCYAHRPAIVQHYRLFHHLSHIIYVHISIPVCACVNRCTCGKCCKILTESENICSQEAEELMMLSSLCKYFLYILDPLVFLFLFCLFLYDIVYAIHFFTCLATVAS